jgi:formylglycine-generating enzyme required for sulfatase activity
MGGTEPSSELVAAFSVVDRGPEYFADEYPRHTVRITRPFSLGKYEVSVGEFRRFTEETGYVSEAEADGTGGWGYNPELHHCEGRRPQYSWHDPGYAQTDAYPVVDVTYGDALAFCRWLSAREGRRYRLPTEAEWEYANRAGTETRYATGDDPKTLLVAARVVDLTRHPNFAHVQGLELLPGDDSAFPVPVGKLAPNAWGLHDMHGNVWEWVADWYDPSYYASSPRDDPKGPSSGTLRVRRGGGWNSFPLWARSSFRNWNTPDSRCVNLGFRVATSD